MITRHSCILFHSVFIECEPLRNSHDEADNANNTAFRQLSRQKINRRNYFINTLVFQCCIFFSFMVRLTAFSIGQLTQLPWPKSRSNSWLFLRLLVSSLLVCVLEPLKKVCWSMTYTIERPTDLWNWSAIIIVLHLEGYWQITWGLLIFIANTRAALWIKSFASCFYSKLNILWKVLIWLMIK